MTQKLKGKTALVTGGTTGIGLATARLFHAEGARGATICMVTHDPRYAACWSSGT